ncbi:hypothetical protein GCM10008023_17480 [Sphingomonas glacialis]|uniref:Uncharacterized protein n=1 Tax=Sphingomonas glacialis TaxID=658225 RepID=A0ABQ3LGV7_9SPHN|nr:hypothetical protein GCM10008023_17480 [Sphingomonas glacialis]
MLAIALACRSLARASDDGVAVEVASAGVAVWAIAALATAKEDTDTSRASRFMSNPSKQGG